MYGNFDAMKGGDYDVTLTQSMYPLVGEWQNCRQQQQSRRRVEIPKDELWNMSK